MTKPKSYFLRQGQFEVSAARQFVDIGEVCRRYRRSPTTIGRWVNDPRTGFPAPIQAIPGGPNLWNTGVLNEYDDGLEERGRQRVARRVAELRHKLENAP